MKSEEKILAESRGQRAKSRKPEVGKSAMHECYIAIMLECGIMNNNLANETSTVCLPAPLNPLKGSARAHKALVVGFVYGISPLGVRGSADLGMTTNRISTVFKIIRSSASSPRLGGKASRLERKGGQNLSISESRAIRACLLIRFFNN